MYDFKEIFLAKRSHRLYITLHDEVTEVGNDDGEDDP